MSNYGSEGLAKYHQRDIKEKQSFSALDGFKKTKYHEAITDVYSHWVARNAEDSLYGHTFKPDNKKTFTLMKDQHRILKNKELFGASVERTPFIDSEAFYQALSKKIPNIVLLLVDIYPKLDRLEKINTPEAPVKLKAKQFMAAFASRKDLYGRICNDIKDEKDKEKRDYSFELYCLFTIAKNYLDLIVKIHTALKNETDIDLNDLNSFTSAHLAVHSKKLDKTISPKIENCDQYTQKGFSFLLEILDCAEYNLGLIRELFKKI